jgi:ribosome-associated toxin RatA of RatAB toxin-antitoxin module
MQTRLVQRIAAPPEVVFNLAARVEDWPRILPHYRWVRVLGDSSEAERTVEMAARRSVVGPLAFPLWWRSIQRLEPGRGRIEFEHVAGITRGMQVAWHIDAADGGSEASISHRFTPGWPIPDEIVRLIVGEYFVNGVARRTLRRIAELARTRKTGL